jgi:hypothetical protein
MDAELIFQTQQEKTPEGSDPKGMILRSRQMYHASSVFKPSALSSPFLPRARMKKNVIGGLAPPSNN